jgi:hypothetical protein
VALAYLCSTTFVKVPPDASPGSAPLPGVGGEYVVIAGTNPAPGSPGRLRGTPPKLGIELAPPLIGNCELSMIGNIELSSAIIVDFLLIVLLY